MPALALATLATTAALLMLWQWLAALSFPVEPPSPPPAPPHPTPASQPESTAPPTITVLKPVKGADPGTAEAIATWLVQRPAPPLEILLGVDSPDDPAVPLIQSLLARHPDARARLLVCTDRLGINRKVSNLIQMSREATGEILVLSDADVAIRPGFLQALVKPLQDPSIGLVHCLYRILRPTGSHSPATRWEAFAVNADFWSQVLQNRSLQPLDYALGAAVAVRRPDLLAIGGLEALQDHLADDNRLGRLITGLGKRTELCPWIVDCLAAPASWTEVWRHQLRWAITIRACQGVPYFLSILANGTLWALLWTILTPSRVSLLLGPAFIAFRIVQGLLLEARFTRRAARWGDAWIPPLKDLIQVWLWGSAFLRRHVVWRGTRFRVLRDGRLEPA